MRFDFRLGEHLLTVKQFGQNAALQITAFLAKNLNFSLKHA